MAESLLPDPEFARRAADLLAQGQIDEAVEACRAGLTMFPWYATGFLLLGSCYESQGKFAEAVAEYRKALQIHPDNYSLHRLVASLERYQPEPSVTIQPPPSPEASVTDPQPPQPQSVNEEELAASITKEAEATDENGVEFLIRRLQEAKTTPVAASTSAEKEGSRGTGGSSRIVTVTLAEIYAHQGEYAEAARAYRRLIEQRPEDAERFERRILELEELASMKKGGTGE